MSTVRSTPRPVLILNAAWRVQLAVARSLYRHGIPVSVADVLGTGAPPMSRAIRNFIRLPSFNDTPDIFVEALAQLIEAEHYDMLIPCSDTGLAAVLEHYSRLRSLIHVGCPHPRAVSSVLNKTETLEVARACGILVPRSYSAPDLAAVCDLQSELRFPIIAKPLNRAAEHQHATKMWYFATLQDLKDAFLFDPEFGLRHLLQDYCEGTGVGVEVLLHRGEPVAMFQHRRVKELPVTGGGSVSAVSEPIDPALRDQAVALLRKLGWEGVAMVEFRRDGHRAVLMEVNGRYWGTLPLAIGAGIDFPLYEWQIAHGESPSVPKTYQPGLRMRWLCGDMRRLASVFARPADSRFPLPAKPSELAGFIGDFLRPSRPAIWSWSDPLPALAELWELFRQFLGPVKRRTARLCFPDWRRAMLLQRVRASYARSLRCFSRRPNVTGFRSVLFVCHGNIIRSPLAEALLRKHLTRYRGGARVSVRSAGLAAVPEERADRRARIIAKEFGVSLDGHRPRRVTAELVEQAEVILPMDYANELTVRRLYPGAARKLLLFGAFGGHRDGGRDVQIADPSVGGLADVRRCCERLEIHAQRLAEALMGEQRNAPAAVADGERSLRGGVNQEAGPF